MRRAGFLFLALLLAIAAGAQAQDFRGAIAGTVTDSSGGRTPGETVTAVNVATNGTSPTPTDNVQPDQPAAAGRPVGSRATVPRPRRPARPHRPHAMPAGRLA